MVYELCDFVFSLNLLENSCIFRFFVYDPFESDSHPILLIRGQKVMLDADLAELYNVTTGNLNKAVGRNIERFPDDFMFQLSDQEFTDLIFHFGRASWGGRRTPPYAFTEQGVAMLSSVL